MPHLYAWLQRSYIYDQDVWSEPVWSETDEPPTHRGREPQGEWRRVPSLDLSTEPPPVEGTQAPGVSAPTEGASLGGTLDLAPDLHEISGEAVRPNVDGTYTIKVEGVVVGGPPMRRVALTRALLRIAAHFLPQDRKVAFELGDYSVEALREQALTVPVSLSHEYLVLGVQGIEHADVILVDLPKGHEWPGGMESPVEVQNDLRARLRVRYPNALLIVGRI